MNYRAATWRLDQSLWRLLLRLAKLGNRKVETERKKFERLNYFQSNFSLLQFLQLSLSFPSFNAKEANDKSGRRRAFLHFPDFDMLMGQ